VRSPAARWRRGCTAAGPGDTRPLAGAAAPALAFAQAIGCWGGWFSQNLYGQPSGLPWAVEISPVHRVSGYQSYATFQPVFLYESLWALAMGIMLICAGRRLRLTGDRLFAFYVGLYAIGRFGTASVRIGHSAHLLGLRVNQALMIALLGAAVAYLRATRGRPGIDIVVNTRSAAGRRAAGDVRAGADAAGTAVAAGEAGIVAAGVSAADTGSPAGEAAGTAPARELRPRRERRRPRRNGAVGGRCSRPASRRRAAAPPTRRPTLMRLCHVRGTRRAADSRA